MPTLEELQTRLLRGLDANKQNPAHDELWLSLLRDYETAVDEQRQTCTRHDRVGWDLTWNDPESWAEAEAAVVESEQKDWRRAQQVRLGGVR